MSAPRRALVLGCGAVAGAAWSIPMLRQVEQELNWDLRDAELIIGTSVGAVLATLIAAGVSSEDLMACQQGTKNCGWDHDTDSGGAFPPLPRLQFPALNLIRRGLEGKVSGLTAFTGLLPSGRTDMRAFTTLIDRVVEPGAWAPHKATWLMAVDANSGQRVALGRDDAPAAAMSQAVCASYAVPACCPPVTIGGRTFVDGGVASPTSADFVLDQTTVSGLDEVIVLAPFASRETDRPRSPLTKIERRVRKVMTAIVDRECAQLRAAGLRVIRLEPGPKDLEAIGYNMLDPGRRMQVFRTAQANAAEAVRAALEG